MKPPGRPNRFASIRAASSGTDTRTAMSATVRLDQLERTIYNTVITRNPHLRPADTVLATAFARAAARVLRPGEFTTDVDLEKRTRVMVLLGRSLRLTATSVTEPKTAGRMRRDARLSPLDEFLAEDDDDDDGTDT